ncbi:Y-family DNA polymerase [Candidatus Nomurabacteria bacterium]|nr:Y-family DNA polymerase [Candidatus Nomurabacteria bacterium]
MEKTAFALVDCNNFFVSCERVFAPQLQRKPVVVLSNNDGCIVSRSAEVKKAGIPMAAPYFKVKSQLKKLKATALSSNYTLYSDMSKRVMDTLRSVCSSVEVYSVDEAFLLIDSVPPDKYTEYAKMLRDKVYQWTGIPVSVGVGSTKTLAKLANEIAKKDLDLNGVLDLTSLSEEKSDAFMAKVPLQDVWGIGWGFARRFNEEGIESALDFKNLDPQRVREFTNVMGYRTSLELRGIECFSLNDSPNIRKGIASTRSFGRPVFKYTELEESVVTHVTNACEKLRRQGSFASQISVFIKTGKHTRKAYYYKNATSKRLPAPSSETEDFVKAALECLKEIYIPGARYKKSGVYLSGINSLDSFQMNLWANPITETRKKIKTITVDEINRTWGSGTIKLASSGISRSWQMKRNHLSSRYTTNWDELPKVK